MKQPSRLNTAGFGVLCATFAVLETYARTEKLVMPRELVDFARASGCGPIDDFYERPGMINPPYVYGWLAGDAENSVVFWCRKVEKSDKPYMLVIKVASEKELSGCPAKIDWWNPPAGLSIEMRKSLSLGQYRYVAEPKRAGPAVVIPAAKVIVNYYDGLSDSFYCYEGQWLFASKD